MRVLADPTTGELVEVLDADTVGVGAYDLPQFRRAIMSQTREKRSALAAHEQAVKTKADTEATYRKELAKAILVAKNDHGATVAEAVAKGTGPVVEAREAMIAAEGLERSAYERLRLCSEDRASLHRLGEWSAQQERFSGGSDDDPIQQGGGSS
jgi:uncharacterized protein with gpF-like domain